MKRENEAVEYQVALDDIKQIITSGQKYAYQAANRAIVLTYWQIGKRIVEQEQKGKERSEYGKALMDTLSAELTREYGKSYPKRNVAITSEFEDSHSNPEKERSRGQTPVTPEILSRLPEIISSYDKVENTTSSKDRKPVLKFEKDINGKNVAVEYVRSKKGMLELQTMYAWENKNSRSVSTTLTMPEKTDPYRTSETYSVITPATKDNIQPGTEKSKTRFQLKEPIEETKDLIAAHNVNADKLNKVLDYDGIPMPSIAITKAELDSFSVPSSGDR